MITKNYCVVCKHVFENTVCRENFKIRQRCAYFVHYKCKDKLIIEKERPPLYYYENKSSSFMTLNLEDVKVKCINHEDVHINRRKIISHTKELGYEIGNTYTIKKAYSVQDSLSIGIILKDYNHDCILPIENFEVV